MKLLASMALALILAAGFPLRGADDRPVLVEHSPPQRRVGLALGTRDYAPLPDEARAIKSWSEDELDSGSPETKSLSGRVGKRIAWFGIVRRVEENKTRRETQLDVEMKFSDGLTDLHQQVVSLYGAGDFHVVIPGTGHRIKKLTLVRVYGKVASESGGVPVVSAQFVRVWDWKLFAFMPYGKDNSNPRWVKLRKVAQERSYSSQPDVSYYEQILGTR